jgi:oligopeptide transport system substrate-binding protein
MMGIRRTFARIAALALALSVSACGSSPDERTLAVSIVGGSPRLLDPQRVTIDRSSAVLMRETRQGLVAFDAAGQIEPALAESWTFTKDGLSVIFRIRRIKWPGGAEVTAADAAMSLNAALSDHSDNRLKPLLSAIRSVVAMTDRVLEIRLSVPRPNLLELLAQPELGVTKSGVGTGPWDAVARGRTFTLTPHPAEMLLDDEAPATPEVTKIVLRGERAAMAIARFRDEKGGLVTGGTIADWPVVRAAQLRTSLIRIDPAQGLFGLAATTVRPFIKDDDMRKALSMAVDRNLLVASFEVPGWQPVDRLLPTQMDSSAPPSSAPWVSDRLADRQAEARRRINAWTAARGALDPLKIALPEGSGMRILFARLRADWRAIGVPIVRVRWNDGDADLRLIDEVAPNRSANWYLTRTGCDAGLPCSVEADFALKNSRAAPDLPRRAAEIAKADEASTRWMAFIPLATPLRWSLVDTTMTGFRENSFAVHPLASLRAGGN